MRANKQSCKEWWFDSPLPKMTGFPHNQSPYANLFPIKSPIVNLQKQSNKNNQFDQFNLPYMLQCNKNQIFQEKLVYSDEEPDIRYENHHENKSVHSTANKSQYLYSPIMSKFSRIKEKKLKDLTEIAYNIVQQSRITTYQKVAKKLLQQLKQCSNLNEQKEQKNIKRRVYDVLNVLIGVGLLIKTDRKKLNGSNAQESIIEINQLNLPQKAQRLRLEVQMKKFLIKKKKKALLQLKNKQKAVISLIRRNQKEINEQKVEFPFIGFECDNDNIKFTIDEFQMKQSQSLKLFGDMDGIILLMHLNKF